MNVSETIDDIRRRMQALGLNMKRLSLDSGNGETYIRDLLSGRSKNPKTAELQNVLDALDKAEAGRHRPQKGARVRPKNSKPPRY
jgi:predicted transcriptional regulator